MKAFTASEAQSIAESVVGAVHWVTSDQGHCQCPGVGSHTTRNAPTDCKVVCIADAVPPGVYCFHDSCANEVSAASFQLRSALGKRTPQGKGPQRLPAPPRAKPIYNPGTLARIAAKCPGVDKAWLAARSYKTPGTVTPASFLHELYMPGERVIVFDDQNSQGQAVWEHVGVPFNAGELHGFTTGRREGVWFLSNPVTGGWVANDNGTRSRRSRQNVTSWRYMLLESDKAPADLWLSVLVQMPLRIAAISTSGGRSIHALVRLDAESKIAWDAARNAMLEPLVILGADRAALSAVRLSRLPACERVEKGAMQELLYLNPEPKPLPICQMEGAR